MSIIYNSKNNLEYITNTLINKIYHCYGLSKWITSDCSPQFASRYWWEIYKGLEIILCIFTTYHFQTDGLSERAMQTQYLRIYCYNQHNKWLRYLLMTEFVYNSLTEKKTCYMIQTALHVAYKAHNATGDTCEAMMLWCKLTVVPNVVKAGLRRVIWITLCKGHLECRLTSYMCLEITLAIGKYPIYLFNSDRFLWICRFLLSIKTISSFIN